MLAVGFITGCGLPMFASKLIVPIPYIFPYLYKRIFSLIFVTKDNNCYKNLLKPHLIKL